MLVSFSDVANWISISLQTDLVEKFLQFLYQHMYQDPIWQGKVHYVPSVQHTNILELLCPLFIHLAVHLVLPHKFNFREIGIGVHVYHTVWLKF